MAENLSPEALELKRRGRRRLIGAATLALLAVIVLPMIFDSEPKHTGHDTQEIAISIPAKDELAPLPAAVPARAAPAIVPADPPAAAPAPAPDAAKPAASLQTPPVAKDNVPDVAVKGAPPPAVAAKVEAKAETKAEPKAEPKAELRTTPKTEPKAKSSVSPATKKEGFAVQLGAFSDADNVKQLRTKLAATKLPIYTEELKTASGTSTRVRAGPYKTREQADKALLQVKKAGVDGKVVPLS